MHHIRQSNSDRTALDRNRCEKHTRRSQVVKSNARRNYFAVYQRACAARLRLACPCSITRPFQSLSTDPEGQDAVIRTLPSARCPEADAGEAGIGIGFGGWLTLSRNVFNGLWAAPDALAILDPWNVKAMRLRSGVAGPCGSYGDFAACGCASTLSRSRFSRPPRAKTRGRGVVRCPGGSV